ncbi:MAG TPA: cytochrome c, partial [Cryomorphaceae bacterium]|nr:cytochrome c [Cryomorphaceae bacterium]
MLYRIVIILSVFGMASCSSEPNISEDTSSLAAAENLAISESFTFWDHAAPIIFNNCTPCHHQDGAGPFSLTDFEAVKKRTKTIRQVVADGYMPPWPADPEFSRFKGEKILSKEEKQTLIGWIDQGAPEGTLKKDAPKPAIFADENSGEPDLIIPFSDTVMISGQNLDLFRIAKIPIELDQDTIIKAIHFKPGNKQLVHHVNGHLINYEKSLKKEPAQGEWIIDAEKMNSLEAYRLMEIANDDGTYPAMRVSAFNYLPGVEALQYPEGIGGLFVNQKAAFLLNTLHYGPSPLDTFDYSKIEVYFAEKRPERPVLELHMGTQGITQIEPDFILPAGKVSTFTT